MWGMIDVSIGGGSYDLRDWVFCIESSLIAASDVTRNDHDISFSISIII